MKSSQAETHTFVVLDTFRGLAAFYVLLFHASAFVALPRVLSMLLAWGVEVVLFFFVLSGFCIHFGQARALARSPDATLDVRHFARRRVWRIYPPFLAALALTFLVDHVGMKLNPTFYANYDVTVGALTRRASWSPVTLAGNLLCLQPGVPTYGTNGPLWSLGYEAFFYLIYPIYFRISKRTGPVRTLAIALALSSVGVAMRLVLGPKWVVPFGFLSLWGIWAFGGAMADIAWGRLALRARPVVGVAALVLLALLVTSTLHFPSSTMESYAWGGMWALLLFWSMLSADRVAAGARRLLGRLAWSSRFSYSLYLAHLPFVFLLRALDARGSLAPIPPAARFALAVAVGTSAGLLLYWLVERHFSGAGSAARAGRRPAPERPAAPESGPMLNDAA